MDTFQYKHITKGTHFLCKKLFCFVWKCIFLLCSQLNIVFEPKVNFSFIALLQKHPYLNSHIYLGYSDIEPHGGWGTM